MNQPTPDQLQMLLQYASKRLGVPVEQLASTVAQGGYEGLSASLSENSRRTLQDLVGDPTKAQALLSSPQVQEWLKRFS